MELTKEINKEILADFNKNLNQDASNNVLKNSVAQVGIYKASEDPEVKTKLNPSFNIMVNSGKVSNQKQSGRCWLFAALNTLRTEFALRNNMKDFELSQNYLSFWDRLEKSNAFYQEVLESADLPIEDRQVNDVFSGPNGDGGFWSSAANLISKYGVVPNYVMPETAVSENTREFDAVLNKLLRKNGIELRQLVKDGAAQADIDKRVNEMLSEIYKICVYSFGLPPKSFELSLQTDNDKLIEEENITPKQFFNNYFTTNLDDFVTIENSPQKSKKYHQVYSIKNQNNVIGGKEHVFLNLPMERLEELTIQQLKNNQLVWFGNDVLKQSDRKNGYLLGDLYQYDELFGMDSQIEKGLALDYGEAEVSHAMTITGVNILHGQPNRWKVENSWGEDNGVHGYYLMDEKWFKDNTYEVVINKKYLNDEELAELDQEPVVLPSWDALS
ncbi:aminopeptidase C [Companilactobacillus bobalius]|uniref:Aminopeptidase n=1 Tax=Companilactobacillus bobalius DSM 19674 TaxID=1423788 RepID=A0A0R1KD98_9LACO|nr:C1 family peptidase [Companilactobacillus bobalius]KRK81629.1 cysteine aminopeptidase [Companilactobacillus bobalius DSM 19674]